MMVKSLVTEFQNCVGGTKRLTQERNYLGVSFLRELFWLIKDEMKKESI